MVRTTQKEGVAMNHKERKQFGSEIAVWIGRILGILGAIGFLALMGANSIQNQQQYRNTSERKPARYRMEEVTEYITEDATEDTAEDATEYMTEGKTEDVAEYTTEDAAEDTEEYTTEDAAEDTVEYMIEQPHGKAGRVELIVKQEGWNPES